METMEISPGLEIDFCKKMFSSSLTLFNTYSWLAENFALLFRKQEGNVFRSIFLFKTAPKRKHLIKRDDRCGSN